MGGSYSFDVVSEVDLNEVDNAINMAMKEIVNRFDLKGSNSSITRSNLEILLQSHDETKIHNVYDVLENKLTKRGISLLFLDLQEPEAALGGTVKQMVRIRQGLDRDLQKKINNLLKQAKLKVNSQIMEDKVRVSSPKKDVLQDTIQFLKAQELGVELQFTNFR